MCLYPKLIKNKKYLPNEKNGGNPPPLTDERAMYVPIGCGKCVECLKKKAREWTVRLNEEIKYNKNGKFITFTFSNKALKELRNELKQKTIEAKIKNYTVTENDICTLAIRRFLERWRKKYKKSVRHWIVTERGGDVRYNGRIHLHGILFTDVPRETINEIWKYGHIWVGEYVNEKTISYIVKYIYKNNENAKNYKSKIFTSAGIGKTYINSYNAFKNKYNEKNTREYYTLPNGIKMALPIYYRNKIYNENEREQLWMNILDKEERYILGEKISVKNGDEEEYKLKLKYAQEKNIRLGYGNDDNYDNDNQRTIKTALKIIQMGRNALKWDE